MPPQPIDSVKRGAKYSLRFSSIDPLTAKHVAECIAEWSVVELHVGYLFSTLLDTNARRSADLFASLDSSTAKRHSLRAAALSRLTADENELFERFLSYLKSQQKTRDKLAHWIIGASDEIADAIVLVDPKSIWSLFGVNHEIKITREELIALGEGYDERRQKFRRQDIFVYTVKALKNDIQEFSDIQKLTTWLSFLTIAPIGSATRKMIFDELAQDARLQPSTRR